MIRLIARSALTRHYFRNLNTFTMCADKLTEVPDVEIDPDGVFKYVLIKVYAPQAGEGQEEPHKLIVRGNKRGNFHADIYDETMEKLQSLGLDSECLGGGRISHVSKEKKINVYGYSQGFGRADHNITKEILLKKYPDYDVSWSNEDKLT